MRSVRIFGEVGDVTSETFWPASVYQKALAGWADLKVEISEAAPTLDASRFDEFVRTLATLSTAYDYFLRPGAKPMASSIQIGYASENVIVHVSEIPNLRAAVLAFNVEKPPSQLSLFWPVQKHSPPTTLDGCHELIAHLASALDRARAEALIDQQEAARTMQQALDTAQLWQERCELVQYRRDKLKARLLNHSYEKI
jgi:hypothetical protein